MTDFTKRKVRRRVPLQIFQCLLTVWFLDCPGKAQPPSGFDNKELTGAHIDSVCQVVASEGRYVERIDSSAFFNLPVGILGPGEDPDYAIVITRVVLEPGRAYFDACFQVTNPSDGTKLAFAAEEVPFTFRGGLAGPFRLMLIQEINLTFLHDASLTVLPGSYAEAGCDGFKALSIKGRVVLSPEIFVPVDYNGNAKEEPVQAFFEATASDWNGMLFGITLEPFRIRGIPDITIACTNIVVDGSDVANPAGFILPSASRASLPGGQDELWRGIYIGDASVTLGKKFRRNNSGTPVSFGVHGLLIGREGFSGDLVGTGILPLEEGDMSGWAFSVDNFEVHFAASQLTAGRFSGNIGIPGFEDGTLFRYNAVFDATGRYAFCVNPEDSLVFSLWGKSRMRLDPSSRIDVSVDHDRFNPCAVLNGTISIVAPLKKDPDGQVMRLAGIRFQEMRIAATAPYFSVGYMSFNGSEQGALAGFPLTLEEVSLASSGDQYRLCLGTVINLMDSKTEGFGGKATVSLISRLEGKKFSYQGLELGELGIHIAKPSAYDIAGKVVLLRNDPVYGDGFSGSVSVRLIDRFEVSALAMFGRTGDFRYYCVDALFSAKPGIPAGPITLTALGGGLFCHMKQQKKPDQGTPFVPMPSELLYLPDSRTGLGLIMRAGFNVASDKVADASVRFGISFNKSGGMNRIGFDGAVQCITVPELQNMEKLKQQTAAAAGGNVPERKTDAALAGTITMDLDFVTREFHAMMQMYVNAGGLLRGIGPEGRAGWAVMHVGSREWYLNIGTPADPVGLEFAGIARTGGYFMAGYHLPDALPVNNKVAGILGLSGNQVPGNRDGEMIRDGKGIAFGSSFDVSAGGEFPAIYGYFSVGAGFDLMLTDYGSLAYCSGHAAPAGINGWFAKGQLYAWLEGRVGIIVKILKKRKKFDVLTIAGASILKAEGPNPMWLSGTVGGKYRILGGMVKGQCRFDVTIGDKCKIIVPEGNPEDMQMIATLTPPDGQRDVDVFVSPQAVFNLPVDVELNIQDTHSGTGRFRARIEQCSLLNGSLPVDGERKWNNAHDVLVFRPHEVLGPETRYTFEVEVGFEEWKDGRWSACSENGKKLTEKQRCSFITGTLPREIPLDEIAYSYPVVRQRNFYKSEYKKGYISFERGMTPYFNLKGPWKQEVRFKPVGGGEIYRSSLQYDGTSNTVWFTVPENILKDRIFRLQLVNIPVSDAIDYNVTETVRTVQAGADSSRMEIRNRKAEGTVSGLEEQVFLDYGFRSSKYSTFHEKMPEKELAVRFLYEVSPYAFYLGATYYGDELFDRYENSGGTHIQPLIRRTAVLDETPWYLSHIEPLIYAHYPSPGQAVIKWRTEKPVGIPPVADIQLWQEGYDQVLSDGELETGVALPRGDFTHLMYTLPYYWSRDYSDIQQAIANLYPSMAQADSRTTHFLSHLCWPVAGEGKYPVRFEYVLPGLGIVTSSKVITLLNPFRQTQPDF